VKLEGGQFAVFKFCSAVEFESYYQESRSLCKSLRPSTRRVYSTDDACSSGIGYLFVEAANTEDKMHGRKRFDYAWHEYDPICSWENHIV